MNRPLWVLDTNVFVSAAITRDGVCAELLQHAVDGRFTPAWDNRILHEYRDVLSRPRFTLSISVQKQLLLSLPQSGYFTGKQKAYGLPDQDDEPFLSVALATPDRVIITGNPKHYPSRILTPLHVMVLSPREAIDRLRSAK